MCAQAARTEIAPHKVRENVKRCESDQSRGWQSADKCKLQNADGYGTIAYHRQIERCDNRAQDRVEAEDGAEQERKATHFTLSVGERGPIASIGQADGAFHVIIERITTDDHRYDREENQQGRCGQHNISQRAIIHSRHEEQRDRHRQKPDSCEDRAETAQEFPRAHLHMVCITLP